MKKQKSHKKLIIILTSVFVLFAALVLVFFIYVGNYMHATDHAKGYLTDTTLSDVKEQDDYITFEPKNKSDCGFIFYPGGKVEYTSYAPMMRDLSDRGITGILVKMPFNLAIFDSSAADGKQDLYPTISHWYIGGHSLGGVMASSYLEKHSDDYEGLILLASYSTSDLSSKNLSTLSITATDDKVLNWDHYNEDKRNLPNLKEVSIEGGIHSYFGDYGIQSGDGTPSITIEEQESKVVSAITGFVF